MPGWINWGPLVGRRHPYLSDVRFTSFRVFTFSVFAFWSLRLGLIGPLGAEMEHFAGAAKAPIDCGESSVQETFREDSVRRALAAGVTGMRDRALLAGKNRTRGDDLIFDPSVARRLESFGSAAR
jgi:hypothetical protein